jgi:molecular chaperone GrpE
MTERRRAGEPEVPRSAAGAPQEPSGKAGAPTVGEQQQPRPATDPTEPDAKAEDSVGADLVEQDIEELLATRKERDEYLELARRTKADFENYRKRAAGETSEAERRGRAGLARELVPVLDNLERALAAANIEPDAPEADDGDGLAHGVLLVYRDLRSTVERAGVETYDPAGERFDPNWHEALSTRPDEGAEPGTVLETVEKGYRLDGQVLRPARVIVSA